MRLARRCACGRDAGSSLLFTFTYATLAAKSRRAEMVLIPILDMLQSVPILGFSPSPSFSSCRWCPGACSAPSWPLSSRSSPARPGTWPSASISRCAPCRTSWTKRRATSGLSPWLAAVLATRRAVCDARAHLEHDGVHVGQLVLRRRFGGDQRRQHDHHAARRRLVHRARHRAARPRRRLLCDRHHADRDPDRPSGVVPGVDRLGRSLSFRAGAGVVPPESGARRRAVPGRSTG